MSAMPHGAPRLRLAGSPAPAARSDRLLSAFLVLVLAAALLTFAWGALSERRAVRALPREERAAVLSHTVQELREFCGAGRPDALEGHCRELASFAGQFDECTGECEAIVRRELTPIPRR